MQTEDDDKDGKKQFKNIVQSLEQEGQLSLDQEGIVTLIEKKKKKKKRAKGDSESNEKDSKQEEEEQKEDEKEDEDNPDNKNTSSSSSLHNPQNTTRLFIGNLPFAVDDNALQEFLPGEATHIKWITDQATGRFYGSAFVEMSSSKDAAAAVGVTGASLMGRPLKINYAPARDGDAWPPPNKVVTGNSKTTTGGTAGRHEPLKEKPPGCCKLFLGNLSYEIDDDGIFKFFDTVQAEVKAVRWIHHKDSGDFKGVGFVDFWTEEACEKAASLNGKNLLGRPIRIDWTE